MDTMREKYIDIYTRNSVATSAVIVNCLLIIATIISAISTDVLHDFFLMSPFSNEVDRVFTLVVAGISFPFLLYGMTVLSSTSALNVRESVQTI